MGGNAVDQTYETKPGRKPAAEYFRIMEGVTWKITNMFPWASIAPVKAYSQKESFGDGDILIDREGLPADWISQLHLTFMPQNMVLNRFKGTPLSYKWNDTVPVVSPDCFSVSLDIQGLQVDFILVDSAEFHTARVYYAFNDLGNFMGRIAERLGFQYGWDGLWKEVRDSDTVLHEKILVSRDVPAIFSFLGYDYARFMRGFATLEEVYEYAATTPYFNRTPYLLEKRNNKSRARDSKRASYRGFLEWMENRPELDKYQWVTYLGDTQTPEYLNGRVMERTKFMHVAMEVFPDLEQKVHNVLQTQQWKKRAKELFNAAIVSKVTGLSGKPMGDFMYKCRQDYPKNDIMSFEQWVCTGSPAMVERWIGDKYKEVTGSIGDQA